MNPSALNRLASFVEEKIGTLVKTFQRTISEEVGNAGPEHCRTKRAIVQSMRKIQSLLRYGLGRQEARFSHAFIMIEVHELQ